MKEFIENKIVLFIPVYSMREYTTNKYKLMNDGNMARIISKIYSDKPKKAYVCIPNKDKIVDFDLLNNYVKRIIKETDIEFINSNGYGENANETRKTVFKFDDIKSYIDKVDIIISEPNFFTMLLAKTYESKVIYWCVASKTSQTNPWFVEEFAIMDKEIASLIKTFVLTKSQVEYLEGLSEVDKNFYNPEPFDYKTIYFPFRLSDKSYKAEMLKEIIYSIKAKGYNNFKVLYSDPNESGIFVEDETFKKISSDKDVYTSILKSKPIIPYFEDSNNVLHISIFEFEYYKCKVIMYENDNIDFETAIKIKNDSEIEQAIINLLEED